MDVLDVNESALVTPITEPDSTECTMHVDEDIEPEYQIIAKPEEAGGIVHILY